MTRITRVLHVGKFYPPAPGGMERVVQLLCEGERAFVDSRVLAANTIPRTVREQYRGVPVTRVASIASIGSVAVCPTFPLALAKLDRDITVLHEPNPLALVSDWAARQSGPLVVWFHSEVLRPRWKYRLMYRPFLTRVLDRASRIIVSSPLLAEHAAELASRRERCVVVPFGIDLDRFAPSPAIAERAAEIRARTTRPIVLFVGRLVPYKGVDVLLQAVRDVDVTLLVAGDGPLRRPLTSMAADLGIADRVTQLGAVPEQELVALYHACDIFVLPSVTRAEAFGMVQIEAMACRKPVISTSLPSGVPWVNRHGETGLVVPPGDASALARALTTLANDDGLRQRMGLAGRRRVEQEFTAARMTERTIAIYRDVLAGRTASAA